MLCLSLTSLPLLFVNQGYEHPLSYVGMNQYIFRNINAQHFYVFPAGINSYLGQLNGGLIQQTLSWLTTGKCPRPTLSLLSIGILYFDLNSIDLHTISITLRSFSSYIIAIVAECMKTQASSLCSRLIWNLARGIIHWSNFVKSLWTVLNFSFANIQRSLSLFCFKPCLIWSCSWVCMVKIAL